MNKFQNLLSKKRLKRIWFFYTLFSLFLVLYLLNYVIGTTLSEKYIPKEWNIMINDISYNDTSLDSLHFKPVSEGDRIIMTTILREKLNTDSPSIYIPIQQTAVNAFIDDELFFEYGHERYSECRPIGNGFQIVSLPQNYSGKELKLSLEVTENHAFSRFDNIWISDWKDAYRHIITENRLPFLSSSFLIVFGLTLTVLLIFIVSKTSSYIDILLISIFSICMGLWTISHYDMLEIFSIQIHTIALIENVSLLIAPLVMLAYMNIYIKQLDNKKITLIYKILYISQFITSIGIVFLHAINVAHIYEMITFHYILFIIHISFFSHVLYSNKKYVKKQKIIYNVGIVVFLTSVVYDLVTYIFTRYSGHKLLNIEGISALGIITFISILMLDLYHDITLKKMEQHEKELLIKRAYTDDLTQINNRRFCSEYMDKLNEDKNNEYSIISLDVNNLKQVNDTFGHSKGDYLIKTAADIISEIFDNSGVVGRMGGDEFIVILPINEKSKIETLITSFKNALDENNHNTSDLQISIACGYATCNDVEDNSIENVYRLADARMYEDKKIIKSKQNTYATV